MYTALLCLLLLPGLVSGETLDYECGDTANVYSWTDTYFISSASTYHTPCKVRFRRSGSYGEIQLTISGDRLDSSQCQVNVMDSSGLWSKTGGNLNSLLSFTRTVKSTDGTGGLNLLVSGTACDMVGLSFAVKRLSCPQFSCDNGQCRPYSDVCDSFSDCDDGSDEDGCFIWTTGAYIGITFGIIAFVVIVSVIAGVFYRRRVVLLRSPGVIVAGQAVVTQSRW